MRKKLLTAIIILMILLSAVALASCDFLGAEAETRVTAVQIADTEIYMSPYGEPSVFQLRPWVIPSDAKNQELTYKVVNYEDREYLAVDSTGRITATRAKEEGRVTIRITSKDNPKAYVDVYVTVEVVAVKKISFVPPEMSLLLGDAPKAIKPQFTPAHAVLGRNVSYASLNENVATVDTNGYVTPVGVGKTTIWVTASNDQNLPEDQLVKGNLQISVNYTPPNFRLSVTDPARALKQIVGDPTPIVLSLVALDRTCDPTPLIRWRIAGAPIPGTEDSPAVTFIPNDLPRGEYQIEATITDAGSQTQVLYSDYIRVYEMLRGIDIMVYNTETELNNLAVNDILRMEASFSQDEYPPDNFRWKVYRNNIPIETITQPVKTLNYRIKDPGEYYFVCEAIIRSNYSGVSETTQKFICGSAIYGNDVHNVYVTAQKFEDSVLPYVTWDPLYYNARFTVQIETPDDVYTFFSDDNNDAPYFRHNGFFVPPQIATLADSFTVSVRSERYGWTEAVSYNGDITVTNQDKQFFDIIVGGFDGYIQNIEELGKLLNYINVFRPAQIKEGDFYKVRLKIPFTYSSLPSDVYPLPAGSPVVDPAYQDILNLILAAFNCYGDSVTYTPSMLFNPETRVLELGLKFETDGDEMTATDPSLNSQYTNENVILHYAAIPRTVDILPIDTLNRTMNVSTSMQLYYAVALGYKPVPQAGSPAELIYNEARAVLRRIINNNMTDAQKVHAIFDYLTVETIYDRWLASQDLTGSELEYESFHLEGVFLRGLAVCDGIAKAFTLLCGMEGIASIKINGIAGGVAHAWNKVLIDGIWYVADATWGSYASGTLELQSHRYLLAPESAIPGHTPYGRQPAASEEWHSAYYTYEFAAGKDARIDSPAELGDFTRFAYSRMSEQKPSIWFDFMFAEAYFNTIAGSNLETLIGTIVTEALSEYAGSYRYYIELTGGRFAAIRLELR